MDFTTLAHLSDLLGVHNIALPAWASITACVAMLGAMTLSLGIGTGIKPRRIGIDGRLREY